MCTLGGYKDVGAQLLDPTTILALQPLVATFH